MTVQRRCVLVCQGRSCQRNGACAVLDTLRSSTSEMASVFVTECECTGQCSSGPTVRVMPDQTWYCRVKPDDVLAIIDEHLDGDRPVQSLLHPRFHPQLESFFRDPDADSGDRAL
ncbi:MAG: (2Fe-2S) ferredoxin domain-containing protein [Cyanobacteria bacterium J06627_8]